MWMAAIVPRAKGMIPGSPPDLRANSSGVQRSQLCVVLDSLASCRIGDAGPRR